MNRVYQITYLLQGVWGVELGRYQRRGQRITSITHVITHGNDTSSNTLSLLVHSLPPLFEGYYNQVKRA
jgi:hypothetical protein